MNSEEKSNKAIKAEESYIIFKPSDILPSSKIPIISKSNSLKS